MAHQPLTMPIGALMRATARVAPEDSLATSAARLRENGTVLLPVVEDHVLLGVLTEEGLAQALADGHELTDAVGGLLESAPTIHPYQTGAEALRTIQETKRPTLVVVDDKNRVMGLVSATDLMPRTRPALRPATIGGMATPFGVYLTTGTVSAGAPQWALMATGAVMFGLLTSAELITEKLAVHLPTTLPAWFTLTFEQAMPFMLFLLGMRLIPLSGIHGAEHQVVHAIERGEELHPEIVSRMPRVHPRCGTNLAVGASLFLGIFFSEWITVPEIRFLVAVLATVVLWRPIGSWMQLYVTTRKPSPNHLKMGIRAGQELLENYSRSHLAMPSIIQRLWYGGVFHVIGGSLLCAGLVKLAEIAFHFDIGI